MVRVVCVSTRPDLIPVVARWHWDEWGHHDPTGSLAAWGRSLSERCHPDRVPATYVALRDDDAVGSACLVEHDMSTRSDLTPWLAGVYVRPTERGHGVGRVLVKHAVAKAGEFGVRDLWLYTRGSEGFYSRLGWTPVASEPYEGRTVTIMRLGVAPAAER